MFLVALARGATRRRAGRRHTVDCATQSVRELDSLYLRIPRDEFLRAGVKGRRYDHARASSTSTTAELKLAFTNVWASSNSAQCPCGAIICADNICIASSIDCS